MSYVLKNVVLKMCGRSGLAVVAMLAVVMTSASLAQENLQSLEVQTLSVLKDAGLNDEQIAKIKDLAARYRPQIAAAQKLAGETSDQREARLAAIKQAIADGKKGRDLANAVGRVGAVTDGQRLARLQAAELRREFDELVRSVLNEDQKAVFDVGSEGQYSGFIIVRLSTELPLASDESKSLSQASQELKLQGLEKALGESCR